MPSSRDRGICRYWLFQSDVYVTMKCDEVKNEIVTTICNRWHSALCNYDRGIHSRMKLDTYRDSEIVSGSTDLILNEAGNWNQWWKRRVHVCSVRKDCWVVQIWGSIIVGEWNGILSILSGWLRRGCDGALNAEAGSCRDFFEYAVGEMW
jgi:hypothetical protein